MIGRPRLVPAPAPVLPDPPSVYCTLGEVAARLRIDVDAVPPDPDLEWLTLCWNATCQELDLYFLDRPLVAPYPYNVTAAAIGMTTTAFRGKDQMSDVSEEWSEQLGVRVPRVPLAAWEGWIARYRYGGSSCPA